MASGPQAADTQPASSAHPPHTGKSDNTPHAWSAGDFILLLLLLSALGIWGQYAARAAQPAPATGRDSVSIVRARHPLRAFTRLAAGDVDTVRIPRAPASALSPDSAFAGRVVVAEMAAGAVLTRTSLLTLAGERWVVPVPGDPALPMRVGDGVVILGASVASTGVQGVVLGQRGGTVLLAVSPDLWAARTFPDSVIRVARRIPPEATAMAVDIPRPPASHGGPTRK